MKNVAIVNVCTGGSTGKIGVKLYYTLKEEGYNSVFCYAKDFAKYPAPPQNHYVIETERGYKFHRRMSYYFGMPGYFSSEATRRFLKYLEDSSIDTIYLLNIHEFFLNDILFFNGIGKLGIKVVYIMIDEYAYLGNCCYNEECNNYLTGCGHCKRLKCSYPPTLYFDWSRDIFKRKQIAYSYLEKLVFVGPAFCVEKAKTSPLMQNKRLEVLDEAIDTNMFQPKVIEEEMIRLNLPSNKIIILCVAPSDNERKGSRYFLEAARCLENNDKYLFVHVGYTKETSGLPRNYMPIPYVSDQNLLASYMSVADLMVFPSLMDTMPSTCLISLACGTPLLCFDISGMPYLGGPEVLRLVPPRDVEALVKEIMKTEKKDNSTINTCRDYALLRYDGKKYSHRLIEIGESL